MLNNKLLAVCIIVLSTVSVQARNFVLTIGGGYSPSGNQVSLEKNVLLFNRILDDYEDQIHQHDVFFADDPPFSRVLEIASPVQKVVLAKLSGKLKLSGEKRLVDAWEKTRTNNQTRGRRPSPSSAGGLKSKIASDLRRKWPGLVNVINPVSVELMTSRSDEFINAIEKHPSYERYRTEIDKQKRQRSATETKAQYERFLRVADNVILAENLRRMGDETRIKEYESILTAERAPLFGTRAEDSEPEPACP